jgi:hypothetical protein
MACGVFYIIEKLLERKCLKWLALLIWTFETQAIAKRKFDSQIVNLTPNQKKSIIDPIHLAADNVRYIVGKLSMRATSLL